MSNSKMIAHAISAVLALGFCTAALAAETPPPKMQDAPALPDMERCYGIVKTGANDCGNGAHNCSGEAKVDRDKTEWVFVPTGLCDRIVGGSKTISTKS